MVVEASVGKVSLCRLGSHVVSGCYSGPEIIDVTYIFLQSFPFSPK